ncbi:MAG: hypothetical protein KJ645_12740, partial [Planctomycetes bacterium]|nr:hypothetical protein [Planctomycetota bacterium]
MNPDLENGLETSEQSPPARKKLWLTALGAAAAYLAIALWLAPAYGPTWDGAKGECKWGEPMLAYLFSGEPDLLDRPFERFRLNHRKPHPDFDIIG